MKPEQREIEEQFRQLIYNRYLVYNSLFLNLRQEEGKNTGIYIPLLQKLSKEGYMQSKSPHEIIEDFFHKHTTITTEEERFNVLFQMIKYIERQVLLFDCVEDAAFSKTNRIGLKETIAADHQDSKNYLKDFGVKIVFTAHPTQFYSEKVQGIMTEFRDAIRKDDITNIDQIIQQLAYTPFINNQKPTPYNEAQNIIYYLRYVYYETFGNLYYNICKQLGVDYTFNPDLIQMGFWPGGDRDGNPFVTAETTLKVSNLLRNTVMKCYYNHIKNLSTKLTFKETSTHLETLRNKLYKQIFTPEAIIGSDEILQTLLHVRQIIVEKYNGLFLDMVDDFIGRIYLFRDHFATLDVRQDSGPHHDAIEEIFQKEWKINYSSLSDEEKVTLLTEKSMTIDYDGYENPITQDTIKNVYQIRDIQRNNGPKSINRYIISNTENALDVLQVYSLFKYCGYESIDINIDIVPLFETMLGMEQSVEIMETLFCNAIYLAHLQHRNMVQTVMLGFSDGTKDGGYLKANWEIYNTKLRLTALARKHGIKIIFFDGRGGPPARGGGSTHQFYAAQGDEIASDQIQLTIQGQSITSIYGTKEHASYNLEQLILAGNPKLKKENTLNEAQKSILSGLAEISYNKYVDLKTHPLFVPYLEEMTTLKFYGETNIGSRPTKRNQSAKLQLKDLRAIPFVGSWSLARQNVPGYYGLGSAMDSYKEKPEILIDMYNQCSFFKTLINNSIMSMKKTFFPLTDHLKNDPVYGEFWQVLRDEYELTKYWALFISGQNELMENEPMSKASISVREQIVLPLLTIQQYALQQIIHGNENTEIYKKLVIRCLFGNINASRNSA